MLTEKKRHSLIYLPFTTSDQETERVYSYNPGACLGPNREKCIEKCRNVLWSLNISIIKRQH